MVPDVKNNPFKTLLGKKITKQHQFMGQNVTIQKLSVSQVLQIQEEAKKLSDAPTEVDSFAMLKRVIQLGVPEAEVLSDEDFNSLPLEELSTLSAKIMEFSGISNQGK